MTDELTPREQAAGRLLALDALRKLLDQARTTMRDADGALFRPGSSDSATLNGVDLGTVSRAKDKLEYQVTDADAFLAWVKAMRPEHVVTETVTTETVAPGFQREVLKTVGLVAKQLTESDFIDPATGEVIPMPPGVKLVRKAASLVVKPSPGAPDAVADALGPIAAQLGLRELEARSDG